MANDTARCSRCDGVSRFSEVIDNRAILNFDPTEPPQGATFHLDRPDAFEATATMRSRYTFVVVTLAIVWIGVTVGLLFGRQFHGGTFSTRESLFGIPFLVGTVLLGTRAIMTMFGKTVLAKKRR